MLGVFDLYSKRKKLAQMAGQTVLYRYDDIPVEFRRQVIHIWLDAIGNWGEDEFGENLRQNYLWETIHKTLAKEYGLFDLAKGNDYCQKVLNFFLHTETDKVIDTIELIFPMLKPTVLSGYRVYRNFKYKTIIEELNTRFEQWAIGYEFINGEIIRKDSKFIHKEIVVKTLELLNENDFEGAADEFHQGHKHYRDGKYKEATNEALKAFESTMKTICKRKGWNYGEHDTSQRLIAIMFDNDLIHNSLQTHFHSLRTTLEAGLPTIRNKNTAHGQGESKIEMPRYLAQYTLNLAATNILFLVEASK